MLNRQKIMLLIPLKPGFPQQILTGIRKYTIGLNHWTWRGVAPEAKAAELIRQWRPDGVIGWIRNPEVVHALLDLKIPSVDVAGFLQEVPGGRVRPDDFQTGKLAAEFFMKKGYKHFAFFGVPDLLFSQQRQNGFAKTLRSAGFSCDSLLVTALAVSRRASIQWSDVIPEVGPWVKKIKRQKRQTAIYCSHDEYALSMLSSCGNLNIRVPDDVAVLGTDDNDLVCSLATPSLSSVHQDIGRIGFEAAKLLDDMLNGSADPHVSITIPSSTVTMRESTDRLTLSDADVTAAIRIIRANDSRRLKVNEIVEGVATSRRSLELKFKKYLGRGIHEEILRARVDHAKDLMRETDLQLKAVATRAGFTDRNRLLHAFRAMTGMSPSVYRRQEQGGWKK